MKAYEKVAELAKACSVEDVKELARDFMKEGRRQAAIDLYRCIKGNDRKLTKHVDYDSLLHLAALMQEAEEAMISYSELLLSNEKVVAYAYGYGSAPEKLPMPPVSRY